MYSAHGHPYICVLAVASHHESPSPCQSADPYKALDVSLGPVSAVNLSQTCFSPGLSPGSVWICQCCSGVLLFNNGNMSGRVMRSEQSMSSSVIYKNLFS